MRQRSAMLREHVLRLPQRQGKQIQNIAARQTVLGLVEERQRGVLRSALEGGWPWPHSGRIALTAPAGERRQAGVQDVLGRGRPSQAYWLRC
jgi:hypothetical protein